MKLPAAKSEGVETLKLHLRSEGIAFTEERLFHPTRKWRLDLVVKDLAIEVNGGLFSNGGHNRGKDMEGDYEKQNAAVLMGFRVLVFSTGQVKSGLAIDTIKRGLKCDSSATAGTPR